MLMSCGVADQLQTCAASPFHGAHSGFGAQGLCLSSCRQKIAATARAGQASEQPVPTLRLHAVVQPVVGGVVVVVVAVAVTVTVIVAVAVAVTVMVAVVELALEAQGRAQGVVGGELEVRCQWE